MPEEFSRPEEAVEYLRSKGVQVDKLKIWGLTEQQIVPLANGVAELFRRHGHLVRGS